MTKLFKKQMRTIAIVLIIMIAIPFIANYFKTYGFSKMFTIKAYKEAFEIRDFDKFMINLFASLAEIMAMWSCYIELKYNKEIYDIEKEERRYKND